MISPNFYTKKKEISFSEAQFIIEPLPESFGYSLGNALRRTLLSSLKGAAVTQIKIKNAPHLFIPLKGVKESVLEIVLNMKQLRFKFEGKGPFKIEISEKGRKKIYAKDIQGEITVINKDLYIAEITDEKTELEIEAIVETGIGYLTAEEQVKKEFGYIPVDAFFSPVKKVNFEVEQARVGRKSNFDRLILTIVTDGSFKPEEALRQTSLLLSDYFAYILSGKDVFKEKTAEEIILEKKEDIDNKFKEIIIDELGLPSRVINALLREKIETVADLIKLGREKLVKMKGVGKKSIELVEEELRKMGIEIK
ncbi:MAG: DNA-directed RNA polymerase subunit alpha [Patescibacteria group bacterium]|nr:DNA-directed RNA polymerase subunit alpha [Patescibacteria group bacterium]